MKKYLILTFALCLLDISVQATESGLARVDLIQNFKTQTVKLSSDKNLVEIILRVFPFSKETPAVKIQEKNSAECNILGVQSSVKELGSPDVHSWNQFEVTYTIQIEALAGEKNSFCKVAVTNPSVSKPVEVQLVF